MSDDLLEGGAGADVLRGGAGDDRLMGNAGDDLLTKGQAATASSSGLAADMTGSPTLPTGRTAPSSRTGRAAMATSGPRTGAQTRPSTSGPTRSCRPMLMPPFRASTISSLADKGRRRFEGFPRLLRPIKRAQAKDEPHDPDTCAARHHGYCALR
ncbi:hypothetical protein [Paracoccus sp. (in: a-proteobacteria)]|uniref:hypothetical protein n=1 Tax=Paracoccus sp. TaxID=267 RepID=UPI00396CB14B